MELEQIITKLTDNDLYKFNMGQVIYRKFPSHMTTWTFKCRNKSVFFTKEMVEEIREQIKAYCNLKFTEEELEYLDKTYPWFKGCYIDFLRMWSPRFEDFEISDNSECGLSIEVKGTWLNTSMYEVPVLAIVNEVYFCMKYDYDTLLENFQERAEEKVYKLTTGVYNIGTFSEFGTRRRLSLEAQEYIIDLLHGEKFPGSKFVGTSNVMIAMDYGERALGTIAHEFMMCVGQGDDKMNPAYSNLFAMKAWTDEYETQNGIALTDTITTDCFLLDFGLTYATLFNGVRHDSGDPIVWGYKMIGHYKSLGIDPKTKTLLFSDSLDFKRASEIYEEFKDKANVAFGIGTYLANDTFVEPLNIVMKTTACNGHPVAKISDTKGKCMCKDERYIQFLNNMIMRRFYHDNWA